MKLGNILAIIGLGVAGFFALNRKKYLDCAGLKPYLGTIAGQEVQSCYPASELSQAGFIVIIEDFNGFKNVVVPHTEMPSLGFKMINGFWVPLDWYNQRIAEFNLIKDQLNGMSKDVWISGLTEFGSLALGQLSSTTVAMDTVPGQGLRPLSQQRGQRSFQIILPNQALIA